MSAYTNRIKTGIFGLTIRLLSVGLLLGISIVLAQNLGRSDFGIYTYAMSWVIMFSMIQRSGLAILLVREVAVYNSKDQYSHMNGLVLRSWQFVIVVCIIAIVLLTLICEVLVWFKDDTQYRLMYYALPLLPILGTMSLMEAVTRGFGKALAGQLGEFVVRHAAHILFFIAIVFGFLPWDATPQTALVTCVLGALVGLALTAYIYKSVYVPNRSLTNTFEDKRWKKSLLMLTSSTGMSAINGYIAIVIAGLWLPASEIASLQIAIQITILISMGLVVINITQAADLAHNYASGKLQEVQNLATQGCWLGFAFGGSVALVLIVGGSELIEFLFGNEFNDTYHLVLILIIGQLFNTLTGVPSAVLNAAHHENKVLTSVFLSTVFILIFIFPLGILYETTGVAWTITFSLIIWKTAAIYLLKKETNIICLPLLGKHLYPNQ